MDKLVKIIFILSIPVLAIGCSTYKARDEGFSKIGYEDKKLDNGTYQLTYYGSTSDSHESVKKLWHKRAKELCHGGAYDASTKKDQWKFDAYTVLPPLFFKNESEAPSIEGKLKCNS